MSSSQNKAFIAALMFVVTSFIPAKEIYDDSAPKDPIAKITAQIVEARVYTAEFVLIANQSLEKSPADYQQARKFYASAYSKYSSWVAYVTTSVRQGNARKLNGDPTYKAIAVDASKAAEQFTSFVDSKTGQSKAVTAILSAFGDLGLKLWNGVKDRQQKERSATADAFQKDAQWLSWDEIKTSSQNAAKSKDSSK